MFSLSLFYMGGMSLNDYMDRNWDREHQPFRPIAAGKVQAGKVAVLSIVLFAAALACLAFAPYVAGFYTGLILLLVIVLYDSWHKQNAASVLVMASARLLVFLVTARALNGDGLFIVWVAGGVQFVYTLALTLVARYEHRRQRHHSIPLIPLLIAGMSIVDGLLLAAVVHPCWLLVGIAMACATRFGQGYVRGD
jgi:4-hydroxybenzoate polyprenyltransferase